MDRVPTRRTNQSHDVWQHVPVLIMLIPLDNIEHMYHIDPKLSPTGRGEGMGRSELAQAGYLCLEKLTPRPPHPPTYGSPRIGGSGRDRIRLPTYLQPTLKQLVFDGEEGCPGAGGDTDLFVDVLDVIVSSFRGDEEIGGDLLFG